MNVTWKKSFNNNDISFLRNKVLKKNSITYSMGSCFANELNNHLLKLGNYKIPKINTDTYNLFSKESRQDASWGSWDIRVHLQYFNAFSIMQEIERAFGIWEIGIHNLVEIVHPESKRTLYQDPYRRMVFSDTPANAILLADEISKSVYQSLKNADAIVITLGIIEVWETIFKKIACNEPGYGGGCRKPFLSFKLLSFSENLRALRRIVQLIQSKFSNKPIIFSVSPVPLARSFQHDKDIFVSNTESKSLLRTATSECIKESKNVFYFHSYEICHKDYKNAFHEDGRHVRPCFIPKILESFKEMFMM